MRSLHFLVLAGLLLAAPRILSGTGEASPFTGLDDGDVLGAYWVDSSVTTASGDREVTLVVELVHHGSVEARQVAVTLRDPMHGVERLACPALQTAVLAPTDRFVGAQTVTVPELAAKAWEAGSSPRFEIRCEDPSGLAVQWEIPFVMTPVERED